MKAASDQSITSLDLLKYGFIALPIAFAGFPLYVLAPDHYATNHGISLSLLGTLLLAIRMYDAIQDPIIGWLTDKYNSHFLSILTASGGVLCLAIYALFNLIILSPSFWFALCMMLAVSAYSVLTIILGAQATLWTTDANAQTRISSAREAFGLIGIVIAVSMPTAISLLTDSNNIYKWYSLILTVLMVAGLLFYSKLPQLTAKQNNRPLSLINGLYDIPPETIRLLIIHCLSMLASSIPAVLVIFYVRDLLDAEHLTGLFLLLYFLSGVAFMPLWNSISLHINKYKSWIVSNVLAVVGFIGAFFLGNGDIWAYALVCVISGMALGADLVLPPSILADQIHARRNSHKSGTHVSLLAFVAKSSLAIASAITLPLLDAVGFVPQSENSDTALMTLSVSYALVPCVLKLLAAALIYKSFCQTRSGGSHEVFQNHTSYRITHND